MANLNPEKLTVQFTPVNREQSAAAPRRYTASRVRDNDKVLLTVGPEYGVNSPPQRLDENRMLFAEWRDDEMGAALHVYCGLGGESSGCAREDAVRVFIQAVRYGDRHLFSAYPDLDHAPIIVHTADGGAARRLGQWGAMKDYILPHERRQGMLPQWASPTWMSLSQHYDPI